MRLKLYLICAIFFCVVHAATAQTEDISYVYPQKMTPESLGDWSSNGYYSSGRRIYNIKAGVICELPGEIHQFAVSPKGTSVASIYSVSKGSRLHVGDLWKVGKTLYTSKSDRTPVAVCYSHDGSEIIVAEADGNVSFLNSSTFAAQGSFMIGEKADAISLSHDSKLLAVASGSSIMVWELEYQALRFEMTYSAQVVSLEYSGTGNYLDVMTDDGCFFRYDAVTYVLETDIDALGLAYSFDIHSGDKYITAVTGNDRVVVVNTHNHSDRRYYEAEEGGVTDVRFIEDSNGETYLMYNTSASVILQRLDYLRPNYTLLLNEELESMMEDWMLRMPGETLDEYAERVSGENVSRQRKLYEEEIATRMADDLIMTSDVTLGNFNMETNTLALNVSSMPTFYLNVPSEQVGFFMDSENLEFSNAIYGVDKADNLELVYLDVYNKQTGETYSFDNRDRNDLSYMYAEETFVPIDLVLMSNMDEVKLEEIKENIVAQAKKTNTISNNTEISVTAGVVSHLDENGDKVIDYNIGFQYDVVASYSAREDFSPGQYNTNHSGAAKSMCAIIKTAFETEFAQYIQPGKKLVVTITGMADNLPIRGRISYDGIYGDFVDVPVGDGGQMVTVTKKTGITDNVQLALLRAAGIEQYITSNIDQLNMMRVDYVYDVKLAEQVGGKYRRVIVEFKFVDVF